MADDDEQPRKKRTVPVWKIEVNNRCPNGDLPAGFATEGTIRADYMTVAKAIGAVPHPAFKPKQEWDKKGKKKGEDKKAHAEAAVEAEAAEPTGPVEFPDFTVHGIRFDRISAHIMGLILPFQRGPLKVLRFLDARLDVEMLNLLRKGLKDNCSVECLQIEWNPLDQDSLGLQSQRTASSSARKASSNQEKNPDEETHDPAGLALASYIDGACCLEALAVRSCNLGEDQVIPMAAALEKCPWQLRQLNLWENCIDDTAAEILAGAVDVYRGLEYLGLGRNMITDEGMLALCKAFGVELISDADAIKPIQDRIKKQQADQDKDLKAKAKAMAAKAKAKPTNDRAKREAVVFVDELEERPAEGDVPAGWILRRPTELKCLSLTENPIKNLVSVEKVQPFGIGKPELTLVGTPVASAIMQRWPELTMGQRKAFCFPDRPAAAPGPQDGWSVRLI